MPQKKNIRKSISKWVPKNGKAPLSHFNFKKLTTWEEKLGFELAEKLLLDDVDGFLETYDHAISSNEADAIRIERLKNVIREIISFDRIEEISTQEIDPSLPCLQKEVEEIVDHVRRKLNLDTRPQGSVRSNVNPDPDTSVILVPSDVKTFSSHTTMFSNFDCSYAEQLLMKRFEYALSHSTNDALSHSTNDALSHSTNDALSHSTNDGFSSLSSNPQVTRRPLYPILRSTVTYRLSRRHSTIMTDCDKPEDELELEATDSEQSTNIFVMLENAFIRFNRSK